MTPVRSEIAGAKRDERCTSRLFHQCPSMLRCLCQLEFLGSGVEPSSNSAMREEMARGAYIAGVNADGITHLPVGKGSHGPLEVEVADEADKE